MSTFELTRFVKSDGPLTKRISLTPEGNVLSNGSACVMSRGAAHRVQIGDVHQLAELIGRLQPNEAIALGAPRGDLPDALEITTKRKLDELNGAARPGIIARTGGYIVYRPGQPAFALLDFDTKGMPPAVANRLEELGGFARALRTVLPELAGTARLYRRSTSAGLSRTDTGDQIPSSNGVHLYVAVADGEDIERFLTVLHARCWLGGLGWLMVGKAGQLLDRSIVDRMVSAPERLVFEGGPVVVEPLVQDVDSRRPVAKDGALLDTVAACPDLTIVEQARLKELRAREAQRLAPDSAKARDAFIDEQAGKIAERTGMPRQQAARVVERQCSGALLPHVVLQFDDPDLAGATVADILADPAKYEGATLADPNEGTEYGTCKARIMRRADGTPWIHSFAHGRTVYELRHDAAAIGAAIAAKPESEAGDVFVQMAQNADLDEDEAESLRNLAAERAGIGRNALKARLKQAQREQSKRQAEEAQQRRLAERKGKRPQIPAPLPDAPWLPQMQALNDVLGASRAPEPPMRDVEGTIVQVRARRIPNMHALTTDAANDGEAEESRLPAPEQPLLTRLNEAQLAELIERHIDYADDTGRSVHLAAPFVKHFLARPDDDALPIASAIATLPMVLSDGVLLNGKGLNRDRGIVFRIPEALLAYLPAREECDSLAVAEALEFLTGTWLCDVATDYTGKCILIAAALTLIERSLLPDRPVFFVTAGRRGGGKTTTLIMLLMAITGIRPAAAAWSPNEEERRKALLAYLMEALPAIIWDNIPRGAQISCPHIERSCTTAFYSDRKLGVSELVATAAATVHLFTGNNIGPRGDLASRALIARLEIDRPDPENRPFAHPDPIGWTEANRGKILRALYTLLLGNPHLGAGSNTQPKTRFKAWWRLAGAAVEHAVEQSGGRLDFADLFLSQEQDDEENASLADALAALDANEWPQDNAPKKRGPFQASDLAKVINDQSEYRTDAERDRSAILREFLFSTTPAGQIVTAKAVGKRLKRHVGEPVKHGDRTLVLKEWRDPNGGPKGALGYFVQAS